MNQCFSRYIYQKGHKEGQRPLCPITRSLIVEHQEWLTTDSGLEMPCLIDGTAWKKERTAELVVKAIQEGFAPRNRTGNSRIEMSLGFLNSLRTSRLIVLKN